MCANKIRVLILHMRTVGLLILCALSISGCGMSYFASRESNPVIQDYATGSLLYKQTTNVFATTASRRLIVIKETKGSDKIITCAEPSPDVGEAFASSIAAGIQAAGGATSPSVAAQYARAVATQIAPLVYRTQGLQLYRDSMYKLCIDRMNEWVTPEEYDLAEKKYYQEAIGLIKEEFKIMQETMKSFYANVKAGEAKVNVDDVVKILEAQKKQATSPPPDDGKKP